MGLRDLFRGCAFATLGDGIRPFQGQPWSSSQNLKLLTEKWDAAHGIQMLTVARQDFIRSKPSLAGSREFLAKTFRDVDVPLSALFTVANDDSVDQLQLLHEPRGSFFRKL